MSPGQGPSLSLSLPPAPSLSCSLALFSSFFGWTIRSPFSLIRPFWNEHPSRSPRLLRHAQSPFTLSPSFFNPPTFILYLSSSPLTLVSFSSFFHPTPLIPNPSSSPPPLGVSLWCGGVTAKGRGFIVKLRTYRTIQTHNPPSHTHTGSLVSLAPAEWWTVEKREGIPLQPLTSFPLPRTSTVILAAFSLFIF